MTMKIFEFCPIRRDFVEDEDVVVTPISFERVMENAEVSMVMFRIPVTQLETMAFPMATFFPVRSFRHHQFRIDLSNISNEVVVDEVFVFRSFLMAMQLEQQEAEAMDSM